MKLLKLLFLMVLVATFSACGDDEDVPSCVQSDWVGTYTGTSDCNGTVEDATVTITANGDAAIVVVTVIPGLESEYDAITPDGCSLSETQSDSGLSLTVESTLDGDNLTFTEILSAAGVSTTCTITATRD